MSAITFVCRVATTFTKSGSLDEKAFRRFLQQFIDAKHGIYLASGGSGEGHALKMDELKRLYEIGVNECKGKIQVNANPPEQHTARAQREQVLLAIESGIEVVNVYGPASWHGFKPNPEELTAYYDSVLRGIRHPIAIAPNPVIGYMPTPKQIADVCNRHRQVKVVNLSGTNDSYFIALKEVMKRRDVEIYVPFAGSLQTLPLGATGIVAMEANIFPKTLRRYIDHVERGEFHDASLIYADIDKFIRYVTRCKSSTPRWIKMTMKVLKMPGGEGGLREPYKMPAAKELKEFADGLLKLNISEINDRARKAGLI